MDIARLQVRLPDDTWQAMLCRDYPELHVEMTSLRFLGESSYLCALRLEGPQASGALGALRRHLQVSDLHVLQERSDEVLASLCSPGLPRALLKPRVLPQPPFVVEGGYMHFAVLGPRPAIHQLLRTFDSMGLAYRLESIAAPPGRRKRLLTSHQERVIRCALRRGYYDVPRRADLEDLSQKLGLSRSGLSELLRRGERRLIARYCESVPPLFEAMERP